jgi:rhodanese-related sulfurtransferase
MNLREKIKSMDMNFFISGKHKITAEKFLELWSRGEAILLDIRLKEETEIVPPMKLGINIPINELPDRLNEIPKDKLVVTACQKEVRGTIAYMYLLSEGFENVRVLSGGLDNLFVLMKPKMILKIKSRS